MTTAPGIYRGIVVDNSDPLSLGRIRVQIPQVLGSATSGWAMPAWAQHDLTIWPQDRLPAIGQGVWVMFEGPDRLTWVSVFGAIEYPTTEQPELYTTTITWDFLVLPEGQPQLISGTLNSPSGVPNPIPTVTFQKSPDNEDWDTVKQSAVTIDGDWNVTYTRPYEEREYWFRAVYNGIPPFTTAMTEAAQIKESNTRLTWNAPVLPWKETTQINGTLKTNSGVSVEGAEIEVIFRQAEGVWKTASKAKVGIDSTWSTQFERTEQMVYEIEMRAIFKGAELDPTVNVRPEPVENLRSTATADSILVSWTNPVVFDLDHIVVRREVGSLAPVTPTDGANVPLPAPLSTSVLDGPLTPGTTYSYGVWAMDNLNLESTRRTTSANIAVVLPPPVSGPAWPNADTTGVPTGTNLTLLTNENKPYPEDTFGGPGNGTFIIKRPNGVYDGYRIPYWVEVRTTGVVIRNCVVEGPAAWTTPAYALILVSNSYSPRPSATIDHCTLIPQKLPNMVTDGVRGSNTTVKFCEISKTVDGVHVYGILGSTNDPLAGNVNVEDSWIHDLTRYLNPPDTSHSDGSHNDGIQVRSGSNINVRRNRIDGTIYNAAVIVTQTSTEMPPANLLFDGNFFGGQNVAINIYDSVQERTQPIQGITVTNNTYDKAALAIDYGLLVSPRTDFVGNITYSGNVYSDGSTPAPKLKHGA